MPHGRFIWAYGHYTTPNCHYGSLLACLISRVISCSNALYYCDVLNTMHDHALLFCPAELQKKQINAVISSELLLPSHSHWNTNQMLKNVLCNIKQ
jgi:hypothetical protein